MLTTDWLLAALALVLVVVVARCGALVATRLGQPRIAGELLAVVALGPTVLGGRIEGVVAGAGGTGLVGAIFPPLAVDVLAWAGGLGLILYMLLVGIAIDVAPMVRRGRSIALVGLAVLAASALLALAIGAWLQAGGGWRAPGAATSAFVIALAAALSAHGVPVVARILEERELLRSDLGAVVVASGAAVTTLALVASGVAVKGGDADAAVHLAAILAGGAIVGAALLAICRSPRVEPPPLVAMAAVLALAVAAGIAGKGLIGTALVGPLVIGVLVHGAGFSASFIDARLGPVVRGALLPIFLGVAALHTDLRELGADALAPLAAILVSVTAAKYAAGWLAARAGGFAAPQARAVGALMQCGGIMTIAISLEVLQAGVISPRMHAALTLVGLVTTVIAGPLLRRSLAQPQVVTAHVAGDVGSPSR